MSEAGGRPSRRDVRLVAIAVIALGAASCAITVLAQQLGLSPEGEWGVKRIGLLLVGVGIGTLGALTLLRPQFALRIVAWGPPRPLPPLDVGASGPLSAWFKPALFAATLMTTATVAVGIGSTPFWGDEIVSVTSAQKGLADLARTLGDFDTNMGLYYLLLHAWVWAGDSEAWVRTLSAVATVATVPVIAILARDLFDDCVGLLSGLLTAGSVFVVQYAQNARAYALALLLIALATWLFVRAVRESRGWYFLLYGAVATIAVYASPLAGLVLLGHLLSLAFLPSAAERIRPFVVTYGALALAIAPLALLMVTAGPDQVGWINRPDIEDAWQTAREMLGGGSDELALAYAALVGMGLIALFVRPAPEGEETDASRWRRSLMISWLALPPLLLFLLSQAQPLFLSRYLVTSFPPIAILAAVGLTAIARRSATVAVAVGLGVALIALQARVDLEKIQEDQAGADRAAARLIAERATQGDALVFVDSWTRTRIVWHLEHQERRAGSLPTDLTGRSSRHGALAASALRCCRRVWLVREKGWSSLQPAIRALRAGYRRAFRKSFGALSVEMDVRKQQRRRPERQRAG